MPQHAKSMFEIKITQLVKREGAKEGGGVFVTCLGKGKGGKKRSEDGERGQNEDTPRLWISARARIETG